MGLQGATAPCKLPTVHSRRRQGGGTSAGPRGRPACCQHTKKAYTSVLRTVARFQPASADRSPGPQAQHAVMLGLVQYSDSEDEREEPQPAGNRQQQGRAAAPAAAPHQQQAAAPPAPASGLPSAAELLGGGAPQVRLPPPDFGQGRAAVGARQQMGPAAAAAGAKRGHPDTRGPLPNPMALDAKVPRRSVLLMLVMEPVPRLVGPLTACTGWARVCSSLHQVSRPVPLPVVAAEPRMWVARSHPPQQAACCCHRSSGKLLLAALHCTACWQRRWPVLVAAQECSHPQLPLAVTGTTFPLPSARCRGRANVATEDLSTMFTKQAVQRAQQRRSSGGSSGGGGGGGS